VLLQAPPAARLNLRMREDWDSLQKAALRWVRRARLEGKRKVLSRALLAACEALEREGDESLYGEVLLFLLVLSQHAGYRLPAAFWRFCENPRRVLHAYSFIS